MRKHIIAVITALAALLLTSCNTDSATVNETGLFSPERLALSGQVVLLGMAAVFFALIVLCIIMSVFGKIFDAINKKKAAKPAEDQEKAPEAEETADTDDGQLIAVITAAAAAYIESDDKLSEEFSGGFRVVSFRRTAKK